MTGEGSARRRAKQRRQFSPGRPEPCRGGWGFPPPDPIQLYFFWRLSLSSGLQGAGPKQMVEKRKHQRTEINEPAYISSGGSVMSCVVRNISPEGAAIDIENPAFVPARFRLVMANGSSVRECRIAWIQQKRIGVTFAAILQELDPDGEK
jgi:hypothetical protein